MSAAEALLEAARAALKARLAGQLTGVFDPRPERASPWGELAVSEERDWSAKGMAGRELRLALTLVDRRDTPARLYRLGMLGGEAIADLAPALGSWRIASLALVATKFGRRNDGAWNGRAEWRVRVMAIH